MISSVSHDDRITSTTQFWLVLALPVIVAAGMDDRSAQHIMLPDEASYRSNLSSTILESSEWRSPPVPTLPWREAPRPKLEWRTTPDPHASTSTSRRIELFPKYRPGRVTDFDYIKREEKPLIKIFEFGR